MEVIHSNGELDKYWKEVEKKNEEARKAARRLEKERKRLELGSAYDTTGSTDEEPDYSSEGEDEDSVSHTQD